MRIGLLTPGFSANERDWCIPWLLNLARSLANQHDVSVFTLRYPHSRTSYPVYGATVHAFGGATARRWQRLPILRRAYAAVVREHRRQPFDVLHGLWADEPGFLAVTAGRRIGVPALVSVLGGELVGFPEFGYGGQLSLANRWLTTRALAGANAVTVGSGFLRKLAQAHVGPDRLVLWPIGVDTRMFQPEEERAAGPALEALAGSFRLLQVAALTSIKDQSMLLQALAQVMPHISGLHLHLVGSGPLQPALADQARGLGLDGCVTFHGEVAHDRLPSFYRSADLFVLSSRFESQSLAVLEAAACGCPIVGTAVGILPDLLPPESLAAVGDSEGLARVILAAAQENIDTQVLRRQAISASVQRLSLESAVSVLLDLYRGL